MDMVVASIPHINGIKKNYFGYNFSKICFIFILNIIKKINFGLIKLFTN